MPQYPTDEEIDAVFFENTTGEISASDVNAFEKRITAAGRDYASIENPPTTLPPSAHSHPIGEVDGLQSALNNKSAIGHTHVVNDVVGLQDNLDGLSPLVHRHDWSDIDNAPPPGTPGPHTHPISDIDGLQDELDGKAPIVHTHVVADITDFPASMPPDAHVHPISEITNLQGTLDGKAPTVHDHTISDVTGLQTALDGKALAAHEHLVADITDFPVSMPPSPHGHAIADVTDLQTTLDDKAPEIHDHVIGDVTGLQNALDGKAAVVHTHTESQITDLDKYSQQQADDTFLAKAGGIMTGPITLPGDPVDALHAATRQFVLDNSGGGGGIPEAPTDGNLYGRQDSGWAVAAEAVHGHIVADIADFPATMPPDAHVHTIDEVTGLQTELDGKALTDHDHVVADITDFPTTMPPSAHTHVVADITDFPAAMPPTAHVHPISEVTDLQGELDGKAPTDHDHVVADITDFPATMPPSPHGHAIADVVDLQGELDGKAPTNHNHSMSDVTGLGAELNSKASLLDVGVKTYHPDASFAVDDLCSYVGVVYRCINATVGSAWDPTDWVTTRTPSGGTTGQVLTKASNDDYDEIWADPAGGGGEETVSTPFPGGLILDVVTALPGTPDPNTLYIIVDSI